MLGDQVDEASKSEIEDKIKAVRDVLTSEDADAITARGEELQQAFHKISEAMYEKAQAEAAAAQQAAGADGSGAAAADDEEVVDATVVDEGENR